MFDDNDIVPPVVPPLRYHIVDNGVSCGGYPTLRNFSFLRRLKLRTIISIVPEEPTADLQEFCRHEKIRLRHISCEAFRDRVPLLPNDLLTAIEHIISADNHPLFLHCLDGRHVTGQCVMVVRKLQGWGLEAIQAEHLRWVRDDEALTTEIANLADLSGVLNLPVRLPSWMWEGNLHDSEGRQRRHPTIKYKYPSMPTQQQQQQQQNVVSILDASRPRSLSANNSNNNNGGRRIPASVSFEELPDSTSTSPTVVNSSFQLAADGSPDVILTMPTGPAPVLLSFGMHLWSTTLRKAFNVSGGPAGSLVLDEKHEKVISASVE
eukprot:PhM_4_TR5691/c0_g1_i1/m.18288